MSLEIRSFTHDGIKQFKFNSSRTGHSIQGPEKKPRYHFSNLFFTPLNFFKQKSIGEVGLATSTIQTNFWRQNPMRFRLNIALMRFARSTELVHSLLSRLHCTDCTILAKSEEDFNREDRLLNKR